MAQSQRGADSTETNIAWLKPEQVEAMRDAAYEGRHGARDDAIVTVLYDTGLRRGELSQVNEDMLDLDEGQLRIPPEIQKRHPDGTLPPPAAFELDQSGELRTTRTLLAHLQAKRRGEVALFPSRSSPRMTGKGINDVVKRLADRADVRPYTYDGRGEAADVSAHTLRHSVAWRMLRSEEGRTLYDVRNRLRHSSILTTERNYDHFETI